MFGEVKTFQKTPLRGTKMTNVQILFKKNIFNI